MPNITRRHCHGLAMGAAVAGLAIPAIAKAATYNLRYGNNLPLDHPLNQCAREFADEIAKQTNGQVTVSIFPDNQLGGDTNMLTQVRAGAISLFTPSSLVIATLVPEAAINAVGFAFANYDQVWKAMDGGLGDFIRARIDQAGLYAFKTVWDNGFREVTTSGPPIHSVANLAGLKIRVPVSELSISLFRALGAAPTSLQFSEVYSALQTKIVDAQENPLTIIEVAKLYEVQKSCAITNHQWDGFWFIANGQMWNKLSPRLQKIVANAINSAGLRERNKIKQLNDQVQAKLQSQGLAFTTPSPDSFRAKLREAGFYAHWKEKFGDQAWDLLENAVGKLA